MLQEPAFWALVVTAAVLTGIAIWLPWYARRQDAKLKAVAPRDKKESN